MTSFEQLLRHLWAVVTASPSHPPTPAVAAAEGWLRDFSATRLPELPHTPLEALAGGEGARYTLRVASELLAALLEDDLDEALRLAHTLLEPPLVADPFAGELFALAAQVAARAGADPEPFRLQALRYRARFAHDRVVSGLAQLLGNPPLLGALEDANGQTDAQVGANTGVGVKVDANAGIDAGIDIGRRADAPPGVFTFTVPSGGFMPVAETGEGALHLYAVTVRQLLDARTARFAVASATLVDLGEHAGSTADADMLLDFGGDSPLLPKELHEPLSLRFVFAETVATFNTDDGTLYDAEASPSEGRLYFKLRLPESWRSDRLPRHSVWSQLECCVLSGAVNNGEQH